MRIYHVWECGEDPDDAVEIEASSIFEAATEYTRDLWSRGDFDDTANYVHVRHGGITSKVRVTVDYDPTFEAEEIH